jgi:VWFA-related protein
MKRRVWLAVALILASHALLAQNTQQPIFRGGVELIEVDVSVVDNHGRPITDMRGPEFTVTVDGKPRRVVSAQYVTLRPQMGPGGVPVKTEQPDVTFTSNAARQTGRLIIIAVDRDNIAFGSGREVIPGAKRFLDTLGPSDKVAFVTIPTGPQVNFTSNHQLIRNELDRVVGFAHRPRMDLNIGITEAFAIDEHGDPQMEAEVLNRFCGRFRAGTAEAESCELNVRTQSAAIVHEEHVRSDSAINMLESLLEGLRDIDGPKSLVWISQGLTMSRGGGELTGLERLADAARTTINVIMLDQPIVDVTEAEKSPTARDDRDLEMQGLELLAGRTRGALYQVSVSSNAAFAQMEEELSGYYLLGVEAAPADRDNKRHPIRVAVRRQGATVRARREFQFEKADAAKATPEQRIQRAMRAPFATTELPMRVATYAYQDSNSAKVRVLVASEMDGRDVTSGDVTIGYALIDREGRVATSGIQKKTLDAAQGPDGAVFVDSGAMVVDPGAYTLKVAIIDATGRSGSVEHPVQAYQMTGVPFAIGDLLLADSPVTTSDAIRPPVEARISNGRLAAYLELYSSDPASFGAMKVSFEVAANDASAALVSGAGAISGSAQGSRTAGAVVPVGALPPGQYVARAIVTRGDQKIGQLSRPFQVTAASAAAAVNAPAASASGGKTTTSGGLLSSLLRPPDAFRKDDMLRAETLNVVLDGIDKTRPALKPATAQVRKGTYGGAARAAFDADDQLGSMFLRGLELYASGQLAQAATQFNGALRMAPDFAPASLYLGACFAAGGRDQEAAAAWRKALAMDPKTSSSYTVLADALLRLRDGDQAAAVLRDAASAYPNDDEVRKRLARAQALALKHKDALASIEPYLTRHPNDEEALLVALHAIYASHVAGDPILSSGDERDRMERYGRAYTAAKGQHVELVRTWVTFVAEK